MPVERRERGRLYGRASSEVAGPLAPWSPVVRYRAALQPRTRAAMVAAGGVHLATTFALVVVLLWPSHLPVLDDGPLLGAVVVLGFAVLLLIQAVSAFRTWVATWFLVHARDPIPTQAAPGLKVAVLTTIVPGKEPLELVLTTLRAIQRIRHDGEMDVWLLDEGDSPEVRAACEQLGVQHFSRKGVARWNTEAGAYKARTKHGNHNSWREQHAADYDVVAQMDPDHVPFPHFLERTLGYFSDPDVGYVVAPQVYGNQDESFVARGSAQMSYGFSAVTQRGANGLGIPVLIGTNHLYRPAAWASMGGYQDSIIEDHLTGMTVLTKVNPDTGNHWTGVSTPDVLAVGEGPVTYSDWFSQQKRWAYGMWEVIREHSFRVVPQMPRRSQRIAYAALQAHYPLTAVSWLAGISIFSLYLFGGVSVTRLPATLWVSLLVLNLAVGFGVFQLLRRFNLAEHERRSWNLTGTALDLVTGAVYAGAAAAQLAGRPLVYVVTAKGSAATGDTWRTFRPQLLWLAVAAAAIGTGLALGHQYVTLLFWAAVTALVCLAPVVHLALSRVADTVPALVARVQPVLRTRRIGDVLVEQGVLTVEQLRDLLDLQATRDASWLRLGDLAVAEGLVSRSQLAAALLAATPARRPLGGVAAVEQAAVL
ncbi:glycosyltransferase [Modestobacter sp. I12A-02628]|uniref:Glycosyltransferase n=1 Tax=Goekera deserti TaxID=2497753 RepID=A0A7K3WED2_9ACTN|nr:glycosyltransferase [Goekera deserti]NDI48301.1 glycosyltransferase [Goekera deserti]NEL54050.1 glycosyltransferase [Goekera deserti]